MVKPFTQTSHEPYDRHEYTVHLHDGRKLRFLNWDQMMEYWFNNRSIPNYLDKVSVDDKPQRKISRGFGHA